ncbi:anti-phage ZorAB system protein ZorA [Aliarcobacter cryaerophilus]|uniref:anti-phage ZorAB system protein ZorA n=1 Tax=Aliarcobacter cryaerophilus TaxID=28198 RepID=UPI00112F0592|nr:anti-phage ZorAB system protein ZorA [Aliarcobacter cryaerophilus]
MTLGELLFKLLPFTSIDDGTVKFLGWGLLSDSDKIITSIEMFLFFIFIYTTTKLIKSWINDKKQINILSSILTKYKDKDIGLEYNNLVAEIEKSDKNLKHIWNEFNESLIKKETLDGKYIIRNSIDSEYFFNKDTMISHVGLKLYSAIPGILLGIGLLGTFFGLYVALVQLNVSDKNQISESIKILINMAGVKFAASIWGLGLSIVFTSIDKFLEFNLDRKLELIQKQINEMFERETAEQNLDKILVENEQQTKALNGLATSLTEKIATEFNNILIPKIDSINEHFSNLPNSISSSISQSLEKPLQNISDTVKNITSNQAEQSTQALETLITKFVEKIDSVAGSQGEMLKESTIQSQKVLTETSNHLNNTFKSMNEMMLEQNKMSEFRDKKILEELNLIKESQNEMLDNLSNNVSSNMDGINKAVNENIEKLVTSVNSINEEQSLKSSQREDILISKINELSNGLVNNIAHNQEVLENIISNFKKEVINIDNIFSKTSEKLVTIPNQIDKFSNSIDKLSNFENTQKDTTEKLQEFSNNINATTQHITTMIENLKSSINEFNSVNSNFSGTISNTKELLSHMNDDFNDLNEKNTEIVDRFSNNVDRSLNDFHKQIENAITGNIIPPLNNAFAGFAQSMAEAIQALTDAIDELRDRK